MERMTIAKTETTTLREMGQPMTERNLRRGRRYQLQALKADTTGFMVVSGTIDSNSIWDVNRRGVNAEQEASWWDPCERMSRLTIAGWLGLDGDDRRCTEYSLK
jgi:hypothetical protein